MKYKLSDTLKIAFDMYSPECEIKANTIGTIIEADNDIYNIEFVCDNGKKARVEVPEINILEFGSIPEIRMMTNIDGHKMYLDSKDSLELLKVKDGVEVIASEIMEQRIKPGYVVLDLGANIGYHTLSMAKLVGPGGRVFAFEPDPENFALLKKNTEINGYNNVILEQKAVSDKTNKIKLYLCEECKGDHRIYDSHDGREFIEIEAVSLDDYFSNYDGKIDFIKMDIQGAELAAFYGMKKILDRNKNISVFTEYWPYGLEKFGYNANSYLIALINEGFQIFNVIEPLQKIEPVKIENGELSLFMPSYGFTNLLCTRDPVTSTFCSV